MSEEFKKVFPPKIMTKGRITHSVTQEQAVGVGDVLRACRRTFGPLFYHTRVHAFHPPLSRRLGMMCTIGYTLQTALVRRFCGHKK